MFFLDFDFGSSSVKVSLFDGIKGECVSETFSPKQEMPIISHQIGWAEQNPEDWWQNLKIALRHVLQQSQIDVAKIKAIGITYQMHGLVLVDKNLEVIRPSIIWCDSRAIPYGDKATEALGKDFCSQHLLNFPANFTLAKLAWVQEHEPENFARTQYYMLPGDYIAMRLTGKPTTTISGISEGIGWDFRIEKPCSQLFDFYGFSQELIPPIVPTFGNQGFLTNEVAQELGLHTNVAVTYRAGDQPNNAFSLNVQNAGEVAASAGTSGVIYGVQSSLISDHQNRINSFAHVNHTACEKHIGSLLCINGTAILYAWLKKTIASESIDYDQMNDLASQVAIGSDGITVVPFGNGAERMLCNTQTAASINGINFLRHGKAHIIRAALEGIAFAFKYGIDIMSTMNVETKIIRASYSSLFLSSIFCQTLANVTGVNIEIYNTSGAIGAARNAGIGIKFYKNSNEAFTSLKKIATIRPIASQREATLRAYERFLQFI